MNSHQKGCKAGERYVTGGGFTGAPLRDGIEPCTCTPSLPDSQERERDLLHSWEIDENGDVSVMDARGYTPYRRAVIEWDETFDEGMELLLWDKGLVRELVKAANLATRPEPTDVREALVDDSILVNEVAERISRHCGGFTSNYSMDVAHDVVVAICDRLRALTIATREEG